MMWSNRCHWSRALKSAVSAGVCLVLIAVILPQTMPPDQMRGGVQIVSLEPAADIQGPVQQESDEDTYEPNISSYVQPTSLIAEPTPTPEPVYVFCNDGGHYYHVKGCRYVKKTSARVTLTQALNAGFSRCTKCNAPKEY